tara:strand:+ start:1080 stop:1322 length:243 start_codon:yes stop_codon:yes gene_type:complete
MGSQVDGCLSNNIRQSIVTQQSDAPITGGQYIKQSLGAATQLAIGQTAVQSNCRQMLAPSGHVIGKRLTMRYGYWPRRCP